MYYSVDSARLSKSTEGINTVLQKDNPLFSVFMTIVESAAFGL